MRMTGESDEDALMLRFAQGDQSAARDLAARRLPAVFALARRMLRDDAEAEDVAQEAMLRLWKIAPDWRPGEARVGTWLHRVALNLCYDRLRRDRSARSPRRTPWPTSDRRASRPAPWSWPLPAV